MSIETGPQGGYRLRVAARLRRARADLSGWARWVLVVYLSLVVLDPLVVVLIAFVRREGIWLAAGVFVLVTTLPLLRVMKD
jgi:hypothetical protein